MSIEYRIAPSQMAAEYIELRGQTRENSITPDILRSYGITAESWANDIKSGQIRGYIALSGAQMVGYCFGDLKTGEILVLAVLPSHECQGIGQRLLALMVEVLKDCVAKRHSQFQPKSFRHALLKAGKTGRCNLG